jgi:SPP1 gp7 family putative phage head morphogenesis protein
MTRTRFPVLLRSRTNLIVRTEVAKTSLALTVARSESVGVKFAEWLTSEDVRVRDSHKALDKVIFAFDDLPDPEALAGEKSYGHYGPGGIFNCRCTLAPLLDIDDVSWPHKVYSNGAVKSMTRVQFERQFIHRAA